ncbi:MAG: RING-HC finger protein [Dehalococcoidia bacterium]|nr:RING-HC finger protein [Dehalococcoidia bacterium]
MSGNARMCGLGIPDGASSVTVRGGVVTASYADGATITTTSSGHASKSPHKHPPPGGKKRKHAEPDRGAPSAQSRKPDEASSAVTTATVLSGRVDGCQINVGFVTNPTFTPGYPAEECTASGNLDIVQLTPMGTDVPAAAGEPACAVCLEHKRQLAAVECGHLLCYACAHKLIDTKDAPEVVCPTCRGPVERKMIKVFA